MGDALTSLHRKAQCKAKSKQSGERCKRWASPGQQVCVMHGAKSPQAQRNARERLQGMVEPALDALAAAMRSNDTRSIVAAARAILDRAGYPAARKLEIEQHEAALSAQQAAALARVLSRALQSLGLPSESPHVRQALAAALMAESGADYTPPATVTPLPPELADVVARWWAGETTCRRLALPGAVEDGVEVEADGDIIEAEVVL